MIEVLSNICINVMVKICLEAFKDFYGAKNQFM